VFTAVVATGVACAASYGGSSPFAWSLTPAPSEVVVRQDDPLTHVLEFTVVAANVGGIGSVSGFADVSILTNNPAGWAVLSVDVLAPFDELAPSDGSVGDGVQGVAGGQFVFPPQFPIDPSLALFRLRYEEVSFVPREVELTLSGVGGVFLAEDGTSVVPFEEIPASTFRFRVEVPAPSVLAVWLLAPWMALQRRR